MNACNDYIGSVIVDRDYCNLIDAQFFKDLFGEKALKGLTDTGIKQIYYGQDFNATVIGEQPEAIMLDALF